MSGKKINFKVVPPAIDTTKLIGKIHERGQHHVKLIRIISDNGKNFWKIETRDGRIGILLDTTIDYEPLVPKVEVDDCFIMTATVQRHAATMNGEVQTFFREVEIIRNFGNTQKLK